STIFKVAGLALVLLILLALMFRVVGSSFTALNRGVAPQEAYYGKGGIDYDSAATKEQSLLSPILPPQPGAPSGDDAEAYEVTDYYATVQTRKLDETCSAVSNLKAFEYVIFENSNEYDQGCSYSFKVKNDHVDEILGIIDDLNPENLTQNTYTIKRKIDDYTSEVEVLEKKRASIDETLANAVTAYDEVTALATAARDVESLAKIIDSKINLIEKLTQERISINEQLDRLERAKAEQLDRLAYTFFNVSIYESKYVDGKEIKDSWKAAVQQFVRDLNDILQDVTINLVNIGLRVAQFVIYFFILLLAAKYGWRAAKYLWNR
ncbi:MAG: hypothetical protein HYW81_03110, partial [Parcubacteria group bacterium]|nr:hypothetical protein [Parcubacteria group bacterium]